MFLQENKSGKYLNQKGKKNDTITLALRKKNCYSVFTMNNVSINYSDEQINIFSLNNFFYKRLKDRPYWNFTEDGKPVLYDYGVRKTVDPKIIEPALFYEERKRQITKDPDKTWKKLKGFRDILKEREPTDEELRQYLKIVKESLYIIQFEKSDKTIKWLPGRAKGTKTYNEDLKRKLETFANLLPPNLFDVIFLNFTCDPKLYKNRADAWKNFKEKNVDPTLEYLRKHCNAFYEGVMESHANGYPHCHYVVWLPKGMFTELSKIKNGKVITYGKLYNIIKSRIPNRIFKVIKAGGKRVVGYICKYISKGVENDIFAALNSEEELSKSQRKELIEFLALKAFKRRKAYLQQIKTVKEKLKEMVKEQVSVSQQQASESEPCTARQCRAYLIEICTNSPLLLYKKIYSMSYGAFMERYKVPPQYVKEVPEVVAEDFRKNSEPIFNSHNFYNDFVNFLFDWENSPLNRKFYWGDDINNYSRMCDGYDFNNDEEWLECVIKVFDFYVTQVLVNHNEYTDVLAGRENLSHTKKHWTYKAKIENWNGLDRDKRKIDYAENNPCDEYVSLKEKEELRKIHYNIINSDTEKELQILRECQILGEKIYLT